MSAYWKIVHKRAWEKTQEHLDLSRGKIVIAVLLGFIYLALVWHGVSEHEATKELFLRACLSIAPLGAFPIIYLWNFFHIQPEIYDLQRGQIEESEAKLADRRNKLDIRTHLGAFSREAVGFMLELDDESKPRRTEQMTAWQLKVEKYLEENLELSYVARFRSPSGSPVLPQGISQHQRDKAGMKFRDEKLIKFIEELL